MMGNLYSERSRSASPATIATRTQSHTASAGRRRTLAWFIARRPGGAIAGTIQYRHHSIHMFEGLAHRNPGSAARSKPNNRCNAASGSWR
jgi:hypothetical protein